MILYENDKVRIERHGNHERIYPKINTGISVWDMLDQYRDFTGMQDDPFYGIKESFKDIPWDSVQNEAGS